MVPRPSTVSPVNSAPSAGSSRLTESAECPGVATTRSSQAAGRRDHVAVGEPLRPEPLRRIGGPHRRAGELGEPRGPGGMIRVPVGQQDGRHPPVARGRLGVNPAQVTLVLGPGIDHDH